MIGVAITAAAEWLLEHSGLELLCSDGSQTEHHDDQGDERSLHGPFSLNVYLFVSISRRWTGAARRGSKKSPTPDRRPFPTDATPALPVSGRAGRCRFSAVHSFPRTGTWRRRRS